MIQNDFTIHIRRAESGDEASLADVKAAGYTKLLLWVFTDNVRAIRFYEAQGFTFGGRKQPAFGTTEEMYVRAL